MSIKNRRSQSGINLVELMIAMALSLLLLGSVMQVFFSTKSTFRAQETLSRIQENARFALSRIRNDLQQSGFVGCVRSSIEGTSNVTSILNTIGASTNMFDFTHAFFGSESASVGSDEIIIRSADGRTRLPVTQFNATGLGFDFDVAHFNAKDEDDQVQQWDIVAATDCGQTMVFLVTNDPSADDTARATTGASATTGPTKNVSNSYVPVKTATAVPPILDPERQSVLYRLGSVRYFVAATTGLPASTTGRSLFRQAGNDAAQALIDGVQRLDIQYGLDSNADGDVDVYRDWDGLATNAERQTVLAVRLTLEFNDGKPILDGTTATVGIADSAEDFKSITTTVRVRNRFGGV